MKYASVGQKDGLLQDCSNSSALAMELLQSCTKPSKRPMFYQESTTGPCDKQELSRC